MFDNDLENGALSIVQTRWKSSDPLCTPARVTSLGFEKIFTVFLIVLLGGVGAIVIFILEWIVYHKFKDDNDIKKVNKDTEVMIVQRIKSILHNDFEFKGQKLLEELEEITELLKGIQQSKSIFSHQNFKRQERFASFNTFMR